MSTTTDPKAAGISGERMHRIVGDLCAFGRKLPGSPAEKQACDYITGILADLGVAHRVQEFDAFIGWPEYSGVTLLGDAPRRFEATGVGFAASTPSGGLRARLCTEGDPRGRILLVEGLPRYSAIMEAQSRGALGVIAISGGPQRHYVQTSPIWGPPTSAADLALLPAIPAVQVNKEDGEALRRAGGEVELVAQTEREWRAVRMPVAEIAGREPHFVVLGAHYCTWADGATDNLAGVALLLELARLYAKGPKPRYGIRFCWWTGHEQGSYAGSSWYADAYRAELHDHAIAYLNVDIVGVRGGATKALRNTTGELSRYAASVLRDTVGALPEEEDAFVRKALKRADKYVDPRRSARNSDQSFSGVGLSTAQVSAYLPSHSTERMGAGGLAWWWQTEDDTAERCDPEVLATDTLIYRNLVDGLINSYRLPFDYAATLDDIEASLAEYEEARPGALELAKLREIAMRLRPMATVLRDLSPADASAMDTALLRVARHLNPVLYHAASDFDFDLGRTSRLLPGLAPMLTLDSLTAGEARMAQAALRRRFNRIAHGFLRAEEVIRAALER